MPVYYVMKNGNFIDQCYTPELGACALWDELYGLEGWEVCVEVEDGLFSSFLRAKDGRKWRRMPMKGRGKTPESAMEALAKDALAMAIV